MIVARLTQAIDPDGRKYLRGKTTSAWPLPVGTPLVLKQVGDAYELFELGPRDVRVSPEAIAAFTGDIEEGGIAFRVLRTRPNFHCLVGNVVNASRLARSGTKVFFQGTQKMNDQKKPLTNGLVTLSEARKVVEKGMDLAARAESAREFSSAMRHVFQVIRAANRAGLVTADEEKQSRLDAILAETGLQDEGEVLL